ncbi:unnamed protein product [Haemonchus placei]|uniref:Protein kinase domain-containing protein n=1 Tax=Haemonchus placei TaxID=6290 RepID=A0A0N4X3R4_HAEPC|nr:unnamed protein product [Haemonchus placei]
MSVYLSEQQQHGVSYNVLTCDQEQLVGRGYYGRYLLPENGVAFAAPDRTQSRASKGKV